MTNFNRFRSWAALWALVASALCCVALWYHVATVQTHEQTLNKVLAYAPNAVIVCNSSGQVVYANDTLKTITGFSEADLVRGGVEQIIPVELRNAHRDAFQRAVLKISRGIEGINYRRIMPVQCKNGDMIVCVVSVGAVKQTITGPNFFAFVMPIAAGNVVPTKDTQSPLKSPTLVPGELFTDK